MKVGGALINKRRARERRFKIFSAACASFALFALAGLLLSVAFDGWRGFMSASARIEVQFPADAKADTLAYRGVIKKALSKRFADAPRRDRRKLINIMSFAAALKLRDMMAEDESLAGTTQKVWLPVSAFAEGLLKGSRAGSAGDKDKLSGYVRQLKDGGDTRLQFNTALFTNADSRDPEAAGLLGALVGSAMTLLITFMLSFPLGVLTAVYLEFFAPRGRWFAFVEVNINNLAAVPSVIFGVLGLAVFINIFGMPRSSPLVGGLVLSLMTLPTIVIASRAALQSPPSSLLEGALSLGATRTQAVFHHVVPASMPGILTGAIIGMAQALGETAPLLIIGMVAFVAEAPSGITDAATALPVQIFLWADSPEAGFAERTATAIIVLLAFLAMMNAAAVILRRKLQIRWT